MLGQDAVESSGRSMKIQIIGYSGSGKSTLAAQLGQICGLPVLHLDSTHYYGDWQEHTLEEQTQTVRSFLAENANGWVIDGNWGKVAPERFGMTDLTVLLMMPRLTCFFSAYKRYRKYRSVVRPDLGCTEKFDRSFRRWVFWDGRKKERRASLMDKLNATPGQKVVLRTRRAVKAFVRQFEQRLGN